jgi:hypothetical protein
MKIISAKSLYNDLLKSGVIDKVGSITFSLNGIIVKINTTDTVGITLQAWLKEYFIKNNIYFREPSNTQEFPDFYLGENDFQNMLEVKAFHYSKTPAFDIANFESYCDSVKTKPYRLDADYLIFGYEMSNNGDVSIKNIWMHKIWEIAGTSERFALKTQVKRDMIYNIRPNTNFKLGNKGPYSNKEEFLTAIYATLLSYKGEQYALDWLKELQQYYLEYFKQKFELQPLS